MSDNFYPREGDALIIVDVQNDFLPGGALAVPEGDVVASVMNDYIDIFAKHGLAIYATRDWHPPDHGSFQVQGGPWPVHCVAGSEGAQFAPGLRLPEDATLISKGTRRDQEGYSSFEATGLADQLRAGGIRRLFIGGLATEYCVLNTVRDALDGGFRVLLLEDAIRAVDVKPGDADKAVREMRQRGAITVSLDEVN